MLPPWAATAAHGSLKTSASLATVPADAEALVASASLATVPADGGSLASRPGDYRYTPGLEARRPGVYLTSTLLASRPGGQEYTEDTPGLEARRPGVY